MTTSSLTATETPDAPARSAIFKFTPFALYALIILTFHPFYRYLIGPDAISYVSIADHILHGQWTEAANPYWSPLMSWLILPLRALNVPGMLAAQTVCITSGLAVLWLVRRLARVLGLKPGTELVAACTAAVMTASFALVWITPDLLSTAIILYYLTIALSPENWLRGRAGIRCGILGAIAYLAKAYNFYYFLAHFVLVAAAFWVSNRNREERNRILRQLATGLVVFFVFCLPWIVLVSVRAGTPTISTASTWNRRLVGPDSPGNPQFYRLMPPSSPHALSMWENPSPSLLPSWSPLASVRNLKQQIRLIVVNLRGVFEILRHLSFFALSALVVYALWGISRPKDPIPLLVTMTILLMPAGYLLVTLRDRYAWDDRYLYGALFLVMLAGFVDIELGASVLTKFARKLGIAIYALSLILEPSWALVRSRNIGRNLYVTMSGLRGVIAPGSRLAVCGQWNDGIAMAYILGTPFYGSTGITLDEEEFRATLNPNPNPQGIPKQATSSEIEASLRGNQINYLFALPGCPVLPPAEFLRKPVEVPGLRDFKIFRLL